MPEYKQLVLLNVVLGTAYPLEAENIVLEYNNCMVLDSLFVILMLK